MIEVKRAGRYRVLAEGREIATSCEYSPALGFRMKGLLGRKSLPEGEGILLLPCNSIHMWFMSFPIDAIFLSSSGKIITVYHSIRPWRLSGLHFEAASVLEMAAGTATKMGLNKGQSLHFEPLSA